MKPMSKQEKTAAELYREERKARLAKAAKQNSKKSKKITVGKKGKSFVSVLVVLALVLGCASVVLNALGMFERGKKLMTVDGEKVDKYELAYYSSNIYNNLFEQAYSYDYSYGEGMGAMLTGFDWSKFPEQQAYPNELEGYEEPTFADYIEATAVDQIKLVKSYVKYAADNGITLGEEEISEVNSTIDQLKTTARNNNYGYSNFLRSDYCYGEGMTPELFEKILKEAKLAEKVQEVKNEEIGEKYPAEEVEKIYAENLSAYAVVDYRMYTVSAVKATGSEETKTATAEEMAEAKAIADTIAAAKSEDEFIEAVAKQTNDVKYLSDDELTLKTDAAYAALAAIDDGKLAAWMFSDETEEGATYVVETKDTGYTVYMLAVAPHKVGPTYDNYDIRHILVKFPEEKTEETTEDTTEETTDDKTEEKTEDKAEDKKVEAVLLDTSAYDAVIDIDVDLDETKNPELYMKAQGILEEYLKGKKTEEAFAELAKEHSEDGNAADGGIYSDVAAGQMVPEFEDWALAAEERKAGDVGIVETEYGYHIMYFIEREEVSNWETEIRDEKVSEEFTEFSEDLLEKTVVENFSRKHADGIKDFIKITARNTIRQYTSTYTF